MKRMKYFALGLMLCVGALYSLYYLYKTGYSRHYAHEIGLMNERLNGTEPFDVLFLGSSRTCHQVNTRVIDSIVGANSFNAGLDGIKLVEINTILEAYLQSHPAPKMVVMDLPPASFDDELFPFYNQTLYYPFLNNSIVYNNLKSCRPVFLLKHFAFLQLMETNDEMRQRAMAGLFGSQYSSPGQHYKGYTAPSADTIRFPFKSEAGRNAPITEKGIAYLKRTVDLCKRKGIPLMIIYPPAYKSLDLELNPAFYPTAKRIFEKEGVIVNDFRKIAIKDDHRFFRDQTHLNKRGADLFSVLVAKQIKAQIEQRPNVAMSTQIAQ